MISNIYTLDIYDDLSDIEDGPFFRGVRMLRPRGGTIEAFERHTYEAGHPVTWDHARGVFRDPRARAVAVGGNRMLVIGRAWGEEPILLVVLIKERQGIGTLITARPVTDRELRHYRRRGK